MTLQTEDATASLVAWAMDEKYLDGAASRGLASSLPYSYDDLKETMVRLGLRITPKPQESRYTSCRSSDEGVHSSESISACIFCGGCS